MKNYQVTDEEIRQALTDASMGFIGGFHINGNDGLDPDKWETNHVDMMNAFLDALPEPRDDWEECRFEDIQKGDRVKNVLVRESGQIHIKEGVANRYQGDDSGEGLEWWFMGDYDEYIARSDEPHGGKITVTLYRIPAPVQHPDPKSDLAILVHGAYGNHYKNPTAYTSDGDAYNIVGLGDTRILPNDITDWEPADIVPKKVSDHE